MAMEQEYDDIIEEAKKYVFAEDIISYYLYMYGVAPDFRKKITGQYLRLIPRAFNEVIGISITFLYSRIWVYNPIRSFEANEMISIGTYFLFAQHLENRYFNNGYNPQKFLYFCAYLAYMAVNFYGNGQKSVAKLAINYIVRIMKTFKTPAPEFWNRLNVAAFRYLKMAFDCGFAVKSRLQEMKIQFVLIKRTEEHTDDESVKNVIAEERENDMSKLTSDLERISISESFFELNDQNVAKFKKFSEICKEDLSKELVSDSSRAAGENVELRRKKRPLSENRVEAECTNPPDETKGKRLESEILPENKSRVQRVLSELINKTVITAFPSKERIVNSRNLIQQKVDEFKGIVCTPPHASDEHSSEENVDVPETFIDSDGFIFYDEIEIASHKIEESASNKDKSHEFKESIKDDLQSSDGGECSFKSKFDETFSSVPTTERHTEDKKSNVRESESDEATETYIMETVEFDLFNDFVADIITSFKSEVESYGETHETFLNREDDFNCTFDILTICHYMGIHHGVEVVDLESLD